MDRIDKILSHEGYGSRKDIKKLLRIAEVLVNGKQIFDPSFQINTDTDLLTIDGEPVNLHQQKYILMNKIMHTVSSKKDGEHQTVFDLLEEKYHTPYLEDHLHLVGRLDMDTEGLLLFTTNGELTHRVTSPKSHISKKYLCILEKIETMEHKRIIEQMFFDGIHIAAEDNDPEADCQKGAIVTWPNVDEVLPFLRFSSLNETSPEYKEITEIVINKKEKVSISLEDLENRIAILQISEGKYHQVKRMFAAVNNKVIFLKRIEMGSLKLPQSLHPGKYIELSEETILNSQL